MALWKSQSVQLVWFVTTVHGVQTDVIFEALFGDSPETIQKNKVPNPQNPFLSVASGHVGELFVQIQLQPGRLDLFFNPRQSEDADMPLLDSAHVGSVIRAILLKGANYFPESVRLATVWNLLEEEASGEAAGETVAKLISFNQGYKDFLDLTLQVNRRRYIGDGIEINRLLRWSVASFQHVQFLMNHDFGGAQSPAHMLMQKYAATIVADLNTVPTNRLFNAEQQIPIFTEMVTEALRIAEQRSVEVLGDA